jgi:TonB family protein
MKSYCLLLILGLLCWEARAQTRSQPLRRSSSKYEQGTTARDGRRVGKWSFYNRDKALELVFDYDSSRIVFQQPDTTRYLVRVGEQWQPKPLTRAPHWLGSEEQYLMDIATQLRYPLSALQRGRQGKVVLAFTLGTDGHTQDYIIENSPGAEFDREVWRVLKGLPDDWIPGIYQGQLAATRFYLIVNFKISTGVDAQQTKPASPAGTEPAPKLPRYIQEIIVSAWLGR